MEKEILEILKSMQSDMKSMQNDIKDLKSGQDRIEKRLDSVENKLDLVYNQTADLTEFKTQTNEKLNDISKDAGFIKHKLNRTEEDVFNIQSHLKIIK